MIALGLGFIAVGLLALQWVEDARERERSRVLLRGHILPARRLGNNPIRDRVRPLC